MTQNYTWPGNRRDDWRMSRSAQWMTFRPLIVNEDHDFCVAIPEGIRQIRRNLRRRIGRATRAMCSEPCSNKGLRKQSTHSSHRSRGLFFFFAPWREQEAWQGAVLYSGSVNERRGRTGHSQRDILMAIRWGAWNDEAARRHIRA